jgi:transcriptional regulator with XRE-family HTH domain
MSIRLKIALLRRNVSQADLARQIGVTPAYLSRMICGHVIFRTRYRRKVARFLRVPLASLFPDSAAGRNTESGRVKKSSANRSCGSQTASAAKQPKDCPHPSGAELSASTQTRTGNVFHPVSRPVTMTARRGAQPVFSVAQGNPTSACQIRKEKPGPESGSSVSETRSAECGDM